MTLAAMFEYQGELVVIGDTLVTSNNEMNKDVTIPSRENVNTLLTSHSPIQVSDMIQKVNILGNRFMVCVAGDASQATNFLEKLSAISRVKDFNIDDFRKILDAIEPSTTNNLEVIGALITQEESSTNYSLDYFLYRVNKQKTLGLDNVHTIGSGSSRFIDTLKKASSSLPKDNKTPTERVLIAKSLGLALIGNLTAEDYFDGSNLLDRYGGAFELLYIKEGQFQKFDNLICLYWRLRPNSKGIYELVLLRKVQKTTYWKDHMIVRSVETKTPPNEKTRIKDTVYLIPPAFVDVNNEELKEISVPNFSYSAICNLIDVVSLDKTNSQILTHVSEISESSELVEIIVKEGYFEIILPKEVTEQIRNCILDTLSVDVAESLYGIKIEVAGNS